MRRPTWLKLSVGTASSSRSSVGDAFAGGGGVECFLDAALASTGILISRGGTESWATTWLPGSRRGPKRRRWRRRWSGRRSIESCDSRRCQGGRSRETTSSSSPTSVAGPDEAFSVWALTLSMMRCSSLMLGTWATGCSWRPPFSTRAIHSRRRTRNSSGRDFVDFGLSFVQPFLGGFGGQWP